MIYSVSLFYSHWMYIYGKQTILVWVEDPTKRRRGLETASNPRIQLICLFHLGGWQVDSCLLLLMILCVTEALSLTISFDIHNVRRSYLGPTNIIRSNIVKVYTTHCRIVRRCQLLNTQHSPPPHNRRQRIYFEFEIEIDNFPILHLHVFYN